MASSTPHVFGSPTPLEYNCTVAMRRYAPARGVQTPKDRFHSSPSLSGTLPVDVPAQPFTLSSSGSSPESPTTATSTLSHTGETFTLFRTLPRELQLKIWGHAIADIAPQFISRGSQSLLLLRACSDSRAEVLRVYKRSSYKQHFGEYRRVIVANYDVDWAFIHTPGISLFFRDLCEMFVKALNHPSYLLFKHVAIDMHNYVKDLDTLGHSQMPQWDWPYAWTALYESCPKLQLATFVCNEHPTGRVYNLAVAPEDGKLKGFFDEGRRCLAYMQREGILKGVEMKVMKWA